LVFFFLPQPLNFKSLFSSQLHTQAFSLFFYMCENSPPSFKNILVSQKATVFFFPPFFARQNLLGHCETLPLLSFLAGEKRSCPLFSIEGQKKIPPPFFPFFLDHQSCAFPLFPLSPVYVLGKQSPPSNE